MEFLSIRAVETAVIPNVLIHWLSILQRNSVSVQQLDEEGIIDKFFIFLFYSQLINALQLKIIVEI